jgi:hypothetical protein
MAWHLNLANRTKNLAKTWSVGSNCGPRMRNYTPFS